jgi:IS4 transposase
VGTGYWVLGTGYHRSEASGDAVNCDDFSVEEKVCPLTWTRFVTISLPKIVMPHVRMRVSSLVSFTEVSMVHQDVVDRFLKKSPVSVMVRGLFEYAFTPSFLDDLFREMAEKQREGELLFSLVVDTLSLAVTSTRESAHAAYEASKDRFSVSVNSFYNKLKGVETKVSRELVVRSAKRLLPVVQALKVKQPWKLKGYRIKIIDGNHLAATERRLKEVRGRTAHPLPGFSLVVLDPQLRMVLDVYPCEDAYAQERSLLNDVLASVEAGDLWIADRAYCTTEFVGGIVDRHAYFLIRQHATTLVGKELIGSRRYIGRCKTGKVYEQQLNVQYAGQVLPLRRITIQLDKPTSRGDTEIHLVTNLPHKALKLAELYRDRWTIENVFQELGQALNAEINTLCYPKAGLLAFCVALYTYNIISVMKAAIQSAHKGQIVIDELSGYYLAEEVSAICGGMVIAIPDDWWTKVFADLSPTQMAGKLRKIAKSVDITRFRKRTRKTRNPTPKRKGDYRAHVSAARILAARNN